MTNEKEKLKDTTKFNVKYYKAASEIYRQSILLIGIKCSIDFTWQNFYTFQVFHHELDRFI